MNNTAFERKQTGQKQEKVELSEKDVEELREAFELFDSSGDGLIAASELHVVMQAIGRNMSLEEVKAEIHKIKQERYALEGMPSSEGTEEEEEELDFQEFIKLIGDEMLEGMMKEELIEAFNEFDPDESQRFGKKKLRETMAKYGEKLDDQELEKLFKETDYDGDGKIGFEDFVRMMMSR